MSESTPERSYIAKVGFSIPISPGQKRVNGDFAVTFDAKDYTEEQVISFLKNIETLSRGEDRNRSRRRYIALGYNIIETHPFLSNKENSSPSR